MARDFESGDVEAKTGRSWQGWYDLLDAAGGRSMSHRDLTAWLEAGEHATPWWRQTIAVNYERTVGARQVGQDCTGDWNVAARATLDGDIDAVLARWADLIAARPQVLGQAIEGEPTLSGKGKFRYWRARLADGTRLEAMTTAVSKAGRSALTITHSRLPSGEAIEPARAWWKAQLEALK